MSAILMVFLSLFTLSCAKPVYLAPGTDSAAQKTSATNVQFETSRLNLKIVWEVVPTLESFGSFVVTIAKSENGFDVLTDIEGDLGVVLWMPSMGHGSSPVTLTRIGKGTYRAERVFFSMKGDWEIRFQAKVNGQIRDTAIYALLF